MKSILITGSTQGIGLGIADLFASRGFHVFLNYAHNDKAASEALQCILDRGFSASLHKADVRDEAAMTAMFGSVQQSGHWLEALVVNAVDEIPKPIDEATFAEWRQVLSTKLDGAFLSVKHSIPLLCNAENGSITFLTSEDGVRPNGEYIAYQVGTAGLIAMATANAKYLATKYRIRVNSVAPGPVRTGLWEKAGQSEELWASMNQTNPTGRVAGAEDVAEAVWFLSQDPRKFLNGATLYVDGGSRWN